MKNFGQMMKQAQQMQTKMAEMQAKLESTDVDGQSGGGMVKVRVNGKGDLKKISIDKSLCDPSEVEMLEDLILAAVNDAKGKTEALAAEQMSALTGGLKLPPGIKLPF
jgi:nucleoid-associated protein EbfC